MKRVNNLLLTVCLVTVYIVPLVTAAQTSRAYAPANHQLRDYSSSGLNSGRGSDPGGNPDVPIDGGISLLIAAGVALGAKVHAARKEKKTPDNI